MSFDAWFRVIMGSAFVGFGLFFITLTSSERWVEKRGREFASRNLAWVDESLVPEFDALTRAHGRRLWPELGSGSLVLPGPRPGDGVPFA